MRWLFALGASALLLMVSCEAAEREVSALAPDLDSDEFAVEGVVLDAKEGVTPSREIPGLMDDVDVGGIAVRPEKPLDAAGVDGCPTKLDAYITYYTVNTDAGDLRDADWPENLERRRVRVEGTRHEWTWSMSPRPADVSSPCVLVVDRLELIDEAAPADGNRPGGSGASTAGESAETPDATGSPSGEEEVEIEGGFGSFPPHEDTDPIFEGTPSPDPCEGAKACREKREEAERDEGE